jgi:hypothetical protein
MYPFGEIRVPRGKSGPGFGHVSQVRVWTSSSRHKPAISVDMSGWNAVVLPRVVATRAGAFALGRR